MNVSIGADILDSRDIDERIEELEELEDEDTEELKAWVQLRDEVRHPEWEYGLVLIRDSYFTDYAHDFASDLYEVDSGKWPFTCIDWEEAAGELQQDYSTADIDGFTYWYRE